MAALAPSPLAGPPQLASLPALSLYVHFPWCVRKCPYCDFNSHAAPEQLPEREYLDCLVRDLELQHERVQGRVLHSIFLGGGTPSLFSPAAIARLLQAVRASLPCPPQLEITLEANPGTIERGRFADYRSAGITRVSLGAQSFDPEQLARLGRIHSAEDTAQAVAELQRAGLHNFNLDLMYALPQQTLSAALDDLQRALALGPTHLSHYQLTLEPGTLFGARPPPGLPDVDRSADIQQACQALLADAGFEQYEVSGYARAGRQCQHNLNYWQFGDYLGIGAGAHGKCSRIGATGWVIERTAQAREPRRYQASVSAGQPAPATVVAATDLPFEYLMNAGRLKQGFEQAQFEARTGLSFAQLLPGLERARQRGLIEQHGTRWRASARGFDFLNDLVGEFLPRPLTQLHD